MSAETRLAPADETVLPDRRARRARGRPGRLRRLAGSRFVRFTLFALVGLLLVVLWGAVIERLAFRDEVLPGVEVAGLDLAGEREPAALASVEAYAAEVETDPVVARAGDDELRLDPRTVGLSVDAAASVRAAREAGRSRNPVEATIGAITRRIEPEPVELVLTWDEAALEAAVAEWAAAVDDPGTDGDLAFEGATVTEVAPVDGLVLDQEAARELVADALVDAQRPTIELPMEPVRPQVTEAAVAAAAAEARALLADPVAVFVGEAKFTLEPDTLAGTLRTEAEGRALDLTIDPFALYAALGPGVLLVESAPVDATFNVNPDNSVSVVPSVPGRRIDVIGVAAGILEGGRVVNANLIQQEPERDTAWAASLDIRELVSSFTTNHPPGQPRVVNIHRAADILQNQIVEPGETFSLNEALGPRTPERGFVAAPVYYETFTEDFGGGVSQIATTFWNAVFYGGYEDVAHTPHSLYFSRYPMGREATVDYGSLDLRFRNDASTGILIRTAYTESSITISFYGNKEGRVVREEEPRVIEEFPAGTEVIETFLLPPGETVTEDGFDGFSVEYARIIERPGQAPEREVWTWRYDTLDTKIYVGVGP